jgi:hypothetical protein
MKIPFTVEQFLDVFAKYNNAIWPLQVVLNFAALAVIVLAIRRSSFSDRAISIALGLVWIWMGIVYHLLFFFGDQPRSVWIWRIVHPSGSVVCMDRDS